MDVDKIKEILEKNMKNLEIAPDSRPTVSVDALQASKSTVSVKALRSKYTGDGEVSPEADATADETPKQVAVKIVRPKDIGLDDPANAVPRAMIFKENDIEGFEG